MSPDDMDLVWPTAKAQLYLSEAAQVKKLIGPEKIRRNKDALRELRCFQEILGDLHAGQFGRAPERRAAAEAAARRWEDLGAVAQKQNLPPEALAALCEAPQSILSFVHCVRGFPPGCSQMASPLDDEHATCASSTRAPSTVAIHQEETQSLATTEVTTLLEDVLWSGPSCDMTGPTFSKRRRSVEQLGRLAGDLSEQMDQEYTALMASIDEIQALMEAEVAGDARLPSIEELEAFTERIEVAIRNLQEETRVPASPRASPGVAEPPRAQRPRWADLSDSEEDVPESCAIQERGAKLQPAVAQCGRCGRHLDKSCFSRRAWRQVRGKGSQGLRLPNSAHCRECSGRA
ncbi:unnamed protein product [Symbiodinium natans]|uniref:Uncharacterized protein n=1 Tax=Symbiodinium natans TaxID=878477 RepID=A0A812QIV7_9DINO|nr:unnamed protein product [Symbiodinium natans]